MKFWILLKTARFARWVDSVLGTQIGGFGRHTDVEPVRCEECGWIGRIKDCVHGYCDDGSGEDVCPEDECPFCGSNQLNNQ